MVFWIDRVKRYHIKKVAKWNNKIKKQKETTQTNKDKKQNKSNG